jgi:hypothetical protein
MKHLVLALIPLAVALVLVARVVSAKDDAAGKTLLSHDVYFALKDNSADAKKKLVDLCAKYLTRHEGTVFFAAGARAEEFTREVNDRDFDVALHIVFKDKAAHDKYQESERHKQFIEAGRDNWKKVRVFDSIIETAVEK